LVRPLSHTDSVTPAVRTSTGQRLRSWGCFTEKRRAQDRTLADGGGIGACKLCISHDAGQPNMLVVLAALAAGDVGIEINEDSPRFPPNFRNRHRSVVVPRRATIQRRIW
jgi:hypothetical protein